MKIIKEILGVEIIDVILVSAFLWMFHWSFVWLPVSMILVLLYIIFDNGKEEKEDENYCSGKVSGYKRLKNIGGEWYSPRYGTHWKGGKLEVEERLTTDGSEGIYIVYDVNDPELDNYDGYKCIIFGEGYIPHERGARVKKAKIVRCLWI